MQRKLLAIGAMLLGLGLAWQSAHADGILKKHHGGPPACEPGFQIIEEVVYQDVVKNVCRMVPDFKKKWVYDWIDDPFCIRDCKHPHHGCAECAGPYCRKLLVKRQIDEPCEHMKCVVETIVEKCAVKVYKKVPCGTEPIPAPKTKVMPPAEPTVLSIPVNRVPAADATKR